MVSRDLFKQIPIYLLAAPHLVHPPEELWEGRQYEGKSPTRKESVWSE